MRVILQRARDARVEIDGKVHGAIDAGLVLLVGFEEGDGSEEIDYVARKVVNCRIFSDEEGKMNLSLKQCGGQILSISQFTLYADTKKGNRPSFTKAQNLAEASANYDRFNERLREEGAVVETGVFGADMKVSFMNDGPVTIIFDTDNR